MKLLRTLICQIVAPVWLRWLICTLESCSDFDDDDLDWGDDDNLGLNTMSIHKNYMKEKIAVVELQSKRIIVQEKDFMKI